MPDDGQNLRCVVMLTAIPIESEAVCACLNDIQEETYEGTVYRRGTFRCGSSSWNVIVAQTGPRGPAAAVATRQALSHYKPGLAFFIGVAGGRKDVRLGDVVIAAKVYAYDSGKADAKFFARPEVYHPSYRLVQKAQAEAAKRDWLKRLGDTLPDPIPRVFLGPIAAGDSVITLFESVIARRLQDSYNDALAVDMESHGFLEAVHRTDKPVEALIIRGISDLMRGKAEADEHGSQELAASRACAFAFELLSKLEPIDPPPEKIATPPTHTPSQETAVSPNQAIPPSEDKENQAATFRTLLQEHYVRLTQASERFDEGSIKYPDQCNRVIKLLTALEEDFKNYLKDIALSDYSARKQQDDIRWLIGTLKGELRDLSSIHLRPSKQRQHTEKLQSIRDHLTWLLTALQQVLSQSSF